MERHVTYPRPGWQEKVEQIGLTYHSHETGPYWDESAYYQFTSAEIVTLEAAGNTLHELCLKAVEQVIAREWWGRLGIPAKAIPSIIHSWESEAFSLYGRFDLAFDGRQPPKLLEYNADTPTALVEASVAQWFWMEEKFKGRDQFNSIHERLIHAWKNFRNERVHFCSVKDHPEDEQTVLYLQDTCHQAGRVTKRIYLEDIGWHPVRQAFVDLEEQKISACFKLYPWEWMWQEPFAEQLAASAEAFIEPPWKLILSNKGILPILWELFPGHPNLLPAFSSPEPLRGDYVRKPIFGREGANIQYFENGRPVMETAGEYGGDGYVYQAVAPIPALAGNYPVFGLWVVNHEAAGLGIREERSRITTNLSRFVPHVFG